MNTSWNNGSTWPPFEAVTSPAPPTSSYSITQTIFLGTLATLLSIVTVVGNIMVMISFKIDKQLQTISNYFLFSLAVADFAIGLISMPLFTVSTLLGYWPLGPHICDTWLALDYLASNASVLNLLIISFDRYFSVTRPLTYRVRRTTNRAAFMIGSAWGISLLLWPPWIYSWPYIEGERTVPDDECYIQFIETNHYITFGTAIAAFYVPVTVMCCLYWRIWRETEKRQKDLPNLQAGKKDSSKRSNSSDEANNTCGPGGVPAELGEEWRRPSCGVDGNSIVGGGVGHRVRHRDKVGGVQGVRRWCVQWWHSGREDTSDTEDTPSELLAAGAATPVSIETPLQSSVSRCTSLNVIRDPYISTYAQMTPTRLATSGCAPLSAGGGPGLEARDSRSLPTSSRLRAATSTESVYTILIRLPCETGNGDGQELPSIKMIPEGTVSSLARRTDTTDFYTSNHLNRRPSQMPDIRIPLKAKIIPKQLAEKSLLNTGGKFLGKHPVKKKKKTQEKKADKKAAKTLSAILLTFIITWTPYNILVLLKPLTACASCIPQQLWDFFYYLCYINSTINPVCYALCNASFRRTYLRILKCKWHTRNRTAMNRGYYG